MCLLGEGDAGAAFLRCYALCPVCGQEAPPVAVRLAVQRAPRLRVQTRGRGQTQGDFFFFEYFSFFVNHGLFKIFWEYVRRVSMGLRALQRAVSTATGAHSSDRSRMSLLFAFVRLRETCVTFIRRWRLAHKTWYTQIEATACFDWACHGEMKRRALSL